MPAKKLKIDGRMDHHHTAEQLPPEELQKLRKREAKLNQKAIEASYEVMEDDSDRKTA